MLTDIVVENYESLKDVAVRLGQFTVITGPTSSGKSAIIRAARHAAFNSRGKDYITHGAKTCKVALGSQDEGWAAGLERGTRGTDKYILSTPSGDPTDPPAAQPYTKLAGKVPEDVSRLVNLSELNFTTQEDPPYLLSIPGGQVAKTLGELTNVTVVLNAAAAAGRKKNALSAELRTVQADAGRLEREAGQFEGLEAESAAVEHAEQALERALASAARAKRLSQLLDTLSSAVDARGQARAELDRHTPPDLSRAEAALARLNRAQQLYLTLIGGMEEREHFRRTYDAAVRDEQQAAADLAATLAEAGTCPTCGQPTADVSVGVPT